MESTEMQITEEKTVYYIKERAVFLGVQLQPRSLVASSTPLGPPWKKFEPETDGVAYFAFDCDERRLQMG